jgi:predicted HicB family RNase H-like nuclease
MQAQNEREKLTLRLPANLHQRLAEQAQENGRSLNAEIVQRLRASMDGWKLDRRSS